MVNFCIEFADTQITLLLRELAVLGAWFTELVQKISLWCFSLFLSVNIFLGLWKVFSYTIELCLLLTHWVSLELFSQVFWNTGVQARAWCMLHKYSALSSTQPEFFIGILSSLLLESSPPSGGARFTCFLCFLCGKINRLTPDKPLASATV